ncbi:MutS protein msh4 [Xylographa bjoerkii]|nr:MutS protein msh4 [Xylographa bjoerkii]
MNSRNLSTSYSTVSRSRSAHPERTTSTSGNGTSHSINPERTTSTSGNSTGRPGTARPKTGVRTTTSIFGGTVDQEIICAITESRGISPTVGLAFVNISTTEATLCQIVDNQTYVKTLHKLQVLDPSTILLPTTAINPSKSKLYSIIEATLPNLPITMLDRKYWGETNGAVYIQQLAFREDVEAIKVAIGGNFFATCCFAACLKYIDLSLSISFPFHSMRIKYEPSEGSMMVDFSTIQSLELIQNLQNSKSRDCLFGLLNHTLTPMGSRVLRSNLLQPSTEVRVLQKRYDAVGELADKEEIFFAIRQGLFTIINLPTLKSFLDVDRVLTDVIIIPTRPTIQHLEQSINNVILLKQSIKSIPPVFEGLDGVASELLLQIRGLCAPQMIVDVETAIDAAINEDTTYQSKPLDLRNQRTYAAGVNGLLDVARTSYKEGNADAAQFANELGDTHSLSISLKYDNSRQYFLQIPTSDLEDRALPNIFINVFRRKKIIECQTLDLVKLSQKILDSHLEVLQMSDRVVQQLIEKIREDVAPLFRISEAIAMLDMLASFAHLATTHDYIRPELTTTLAIKNGRHPIREKIHSDKFIPNDVYATQQTRFQIITGCNMSGKSTYIRSVALMAVMAQIGSFVPAAYASFPIHYQLFARVSMDDSIEANTSTFAAEMRETAFILGNINNRSLVIVDELGRGTSTRDGLCIAIAIAEAMIESKALVWFVTHFRDLARFLAERPGVVNLHLAVDMANADRMLMLYKIASGYVQEDHYGIALAKVVDLPLRVIEVAEEVSRALKASSKRKKKHCKTVVQARRNKLLLGLREQLRQAKEGNMQGEVLRSWLKKLQDEFVRRMSALDDELQQLDQDEEGQAAATESEGGIGRATNVSTESVSHRDSSSDAFEMSGAL